MKATFFGRTMFFGHDAQRDVVGCKPVANCVLGDLLAEWGQEELTAKVSCDSLAVDILRKNVANENLRLLVGQHRWSPALLVRPGGALFLHNSGGQSVLGAVRHVDTVHVQRQLDFGIWHAHVLLRFEAHVFRTNAHRLRCVDALIFALTAK